MTYPPQGTAVTDLSPAHKDAATGVHGVGASTVDSVANRNSAISTHETGAKHRWTLNKLRKGAGPGVDPTEIDVPSGVSFTELAGAQNKIVTTINTWEDWDLSAIVPAGTKAVLVAIGGSTVRHNAGARKNGSALERRALTPDLASFSEDSWITTILTECDVNRVIEIYCASIGLYFNILGYWS